MKFLNKVSNKVLNSNKPNTLVLGNKYFNKFKNDVQMINTVYGKIYKNMELQLDNNWYTFNNKGKSQTVLIKLDKINRKCIKIQ